MTNAFDLHYENEDSAPGEIYRMLLEYFLSYRDLNQSPITTVICQRKINQLMCPVGQALKNRPKVVPVGHTVEGD